MDTPERAPSPSVNRWGSFAGIPTAVSINSPTSAAANNFHAGAATTTPTPTPTTISAAAANNSNNTTSSSSSSADFTTVALRQISEAQQAQSQLIRHLSERLIQLEGVDHPHHRRNSPISSPLLLMRAPPRTMDAIQALRLRTDLPQWGPKALALLEVFSSCPSEETANTLADGIWELLQTHLAMGPPPSTSPHHPANAATTSSSSAGGGFFGRSNVNALMSSAAHLFVGGVLGWIAIMILFSGEGK